MVHVWGVRMASHVGHVAPFHRRRRAMGGNVSATEAAAAAAAATTTALGKGGLRNHQENDEHAKRCPHVSSASDNGKGSAAENAPEARVFQPPAPSPGPRRVHMCVPRLRLRA